MKKRLLSMFLVAMLMPFVMHAQTNNVTIIQADTTTTGCNSFTWDVNDSTYTVSGAYSHTSNDTVFILDLQLGYDTSFTIPTPITAGCTYTWGDSTINESGTYTLHFSSAEGCDSIVTMDFIIQDTSYVTLHDTACASKEFFGTEYSTDTVVVVIDTTSTCPIEYTLNLTIITPDTLRDTNTIKACDKYSYRFITGTAEITVTESTIVNSDDDPTAQQPRYKNVFHPRTVEKCFDSTSFLNITINSSSYTHVDVVDCDLAEYLITYKADNGKERDSLFQFIYSTVDTVKRVSKDSITGCDNNVVLNVTVNRSPVITIDGPTSVQPGGSATLTATSNQSNMSWTWSDNSHNDSITINNINNNTDVVLFGTNTETNCSTETSVTILCNVGIEEVADQQVVIYPNPATSFVTIESAHAISSISVYNAIGQTVYATGAQGSKTTMDVSSYANGTYMLRMVLANGTEVVRSMIVRK